MADEDEHIFEDTPASTSISKERADGQDSRATARVGEEPDAQSTRVTRGRGIAARAAEHESEIQHKNLPEEAAIKFEKAGEKGKKRHK